MKDKQSAFFKSSELAQPDRLYYLDWLRVSAIFVIFVHHCAKFFDYHTFTIYNPERSLFFSGLREFDFLWIMPLFFVISGAAVYFSLNTRKSGLFIKDRVLRIFIPLVFLGTFVINPPQVYLEKLYGGQTASDFIHWYPQFFDGLYLFSDGNFAPLGIGTHLWYLMYLFIFSLILLPVFIPNKSSGESFLSRLSRFFERPWSMFLLFIPISITAAASEILGIGFLRYAGGWDPMSFIVFFILGYLMFSNKRIQENIKKYSLISLIIAIILSAFYIDSHFGINLTIPGVTRHMLHQNGASYPLDSSMCIFVEAFSGIRRLVLDDRIVGAWSAIFKFYKSISCLLLQKQSCRFISCTRPSFTSSAIRSSCGTAASLQNSS